ncbi:Bug family tripartite tricarboxylate transporter substrate binding protein [Pseudochelatococcus sp. B33]
MKKRLGNTFTALTTIVVGTLASFGAQAQAWPERAITIVVPFAAGGGADPVARTVAVALQEAFRQPVVVDFRPGANGAIGANIVAKAKPDGYTLMVTSQAPLVNVKFGKDLPYDPDRDLVSIAQIAESPFMLTASAKFPPNSLQELVEHAKEHPGEVNVGVSSFGGLGHLSAVILQEATGTKLTAVPYGGVGERIADLMAGTIDISTGIGASGFLPGIHDGSLKPLVVMGDTRLPELPEIPTAIEAGYPDAVSSGWYMLSAPRDLPPELVEQINEKVVAYLNRADIKEKFIQFGNMVKTGSPEDAKALIQRDTNVLKDLIDRGIFTVQ